MVSTIKVISGNAADATAYYQSLYYEAHHEGQWFGDAAKLLGLSGAATSQELQRILCGQTPKGEQLVRPFHKRVRKIQDKNHQNQAVKEESGEKDKDKAAQSKEDKNVLGVDLTHSVPKSVSMLWALSGPVQRKKLEDCCLNAAKETNRWAEVNLPLARRGWNGKKRVSSKLVGAHFLHTLSRANEPQLHVHSVIANMVYGRDGRWSKLDTKQLHSWTPAMGRMFRATLAKLLKQELGLELTRPRDKDNKEVSWFQVKGVPEELQRSNSSRRFAIEKMAGPHGVAKGKYAALVRQSANINTRESKDRHVALDEVFEKARAQADELGFTKEKQEKLVGRTRLLSPKEFEKAYEEAFNLTLERLTDDVAHFRPCDVVREVVEAIQHLGYGGTEIASRVLDDVLQHPELIPLREYQGHDQFTTKEMWKLERQLFDDVDAMKEREGANVSNATLDGVLKSHKHLSDEQQRAAKALLQGHGSLRVLTGHAGAGKSTALAAVKEGLEKEGYQVLGGAIAGATTQDLASKTGIESRTVASYLHHYDKTESQRIAESVGHHAKMLGREALGEVTWSKESHRFYSKTVLILDEAGMLSTKELARLTAIVKKADATLILAGDVEQLPAIGAGTPLTRLVNKASHSHLSTNLRQQDPEDRKAVSKLRAGEIEQALESYVRRGRLLTKYGHQETVEALVEAWSESGGADRPKRHMILTQTRADAEGVNLLCQFERLRQDSERGKATTLGQSIIVDGIRYHEGDRILFHQSIRSQGIENGYFAKIEKIDRRDRRISIELERERTPRDKARGLCQRVTIDVADLKRDQLSLGYAATSHKLQGATVDHAYVLLSGPMGSKEMAYVQATRARHSTHFFADAKAAGPDMELLHKTLKRSAAKKMAHDIGQHPSQQVER